MDESLRHSSARHLARYQRTFVVGFVLSLAGCGGSETASSPGAAAPLASESDAPGVAAEDWPGYNRTLAGDRFSPLAEIDRSNVAQLRIACSYTLPEVSAMQAGPIVIDGTMYFTTERNSY